MSVVSAHESRLFPRELDGLVLSNEYCWNKILGFINSDNFSPI